MSTLQVANLHFTTTGEQRIEYTGNNVIRVQGKGLVLPRVDAANTPSPEPGMLLYNTTTNTMVMMANTSAIVTVPSNTVVEAAFAHSNLTYAAINSAFAVINAAYTSSNADYVVSNAAFSKANSSLQNTTGVFSGTLTTTNDVISGGVLQALTTVQSSSGADLSLNANGANRDVIYKVNGTELARLVGSTARFGIGTASPSAKLHVSTGATGGLAYFQGSARTMYFEDDGTNARISTEGTGPLALRAASSGGNHLIIDGSGRVTKPFQPCFSAKGNQGTTYTNQVVPLNVAITNNGGYYSTSTYRFTAPVAGYYWLTLSAILGPSAGGTSLTIIRKNATQIASIHRNTSSSYLFSWEQGSCSVITYLDVNDYVDAFQTNDGTVYSGAEYTIFSGYLIG